MLVIALLIFSSAAGFWKERKEAQCPTAPKDKTPSPSHRSTGSSDWVPSDLTFDTSRSCDAQLQLTNRETQTPVWKSRFPKEELEVLHVKEKQTLDAITKGLKECLRDGESPEWRRAHQERLASYNSIKEKAKVLLWRDRQARNARLRAKEMNKYGPTMQRFVG